MFNIKRVVHKESNPIAYILGLSQGQKYRKSGAGEREREREREGGGGRHGKVGEGGDRQISK